MSRQISWDMSDYVHRFGGRYIVADYHDGRYHAPMRPDIVRVTGCYAICGSLASIANSVYSYKRRSDALRRARAIYAPDDDDVL
jgi:hypothetical protein